MYNIQQLLRGLVLIVIVIHCTSAFLWSSRSKDDHSETSHPSATPQTSMDNAHVRQVSNEDISLIEPLPSQTHELSTSNIETSDFHEAITSDNTNNDHDSVAKEKSHNSFSFYNFIFGENEAAVTEHPQATHSLEDTTEPSGSAFRRTSSSDAYFIEATRKAEQMFNAGASIAPQRHRQSTPPSDKPSRSRSWSGSTRTSTATTHQDTVNNGNMDSFPTEPTRFGKGREAGVKVGNKEQGMFGDNNLKVKVEPGMEPTDEKEKTEPSEMEEWLEEDDDDEEEEEETSKERSHVGKTSPCSTCGQRGESLDAGSTSGGMSEEEVKNIRMHMLADLLMQKMRIDPADLASSKLRRHDAAYRMRLPKLPRAFLDETIRDNMRGDERDDFYARNQEAIVPSKDMGRHCVSMRATGCYKFRFNGEINSEVESAELWMYKTRDVRDIHGQTFIVYELERKRNDQRLRRRNLIARKDTVTKEGWVSLNVTRAVQRWFSKRRDGEMLAIRCKTCHTSNHRAIFGAKDGYKPLLIIKFTDYTKSRDRRSEENCNPITECCKRPLEVSFNDIGLSTIIQPDTLAVDYCYGYCDGVDSFTYNHTSIKQSIRWADSTSAETREQLKPCCVPLSFKDTYVLNVQDGMIVMKVLPKVIVDRCGCV